MADNNSLKLTKQQKRDKRRAELVSSGLREPKVSKKQKLQREVDSGKKILQSNGKSGTSSLPNGVPNGIPVTWNVPKTRLMKADDQNFKNVMQTSYEGFKVDEPDVFSSEESSFSFHDTFQTVLTSLDYDFDVIQPLGLGTPLAITKVKRILCGEEGTTYKYLGLRMFSVPFSDGKYLKKLQKCNSRLTLRTQELMEGAEVNPYNIVLINQCLPASEEHKLKVEPMFKEQQVAQSISWHADSMLKHHSAIACYHWVPVVKEGDKEWKIGLRVEPHSEGPSKNQRSFGSSTADGAVVNSREGECRAPPVALGLPNGGVYYLLGNFNHHHQHAVFAGTGLRFSSTHRVGREGHDFAFIRNKVNKCLNSKVAGLKNVRNLLVVFTDLESEWLRQWYCQGKKHSDTHMWWHRPIEELLSLWRRLGQRIHSLLRRLESQADSEKAHTGKAKDSFSKECYDEVEAGINSILSMRKGWQERNMDPVVVGLDAEHKPLPFPPTEYPECTFSQEMIDNVAKWKQLEQQNNK